MSLPRTPTPTAPVPAPSPQRVLAAARSGLTSHATPRALADWLWTHTSQPNGDPWGADPDTLTHAAHQLAAFVRSTP